MKKIAFYGSIWVDDFKIINSILKKWLNVNRLETKIKLSGEEITYQNETIYIYCHADTSSEEEDPSYLIEGEMAASIDDARVKLNNLLKICESYNIEHDFEYVEVDKDGKEVSEQFYL
jgi:hypothetical protein